MGVSAVMPDIAVVGGGVAGAMAALTARDRGARVLLVRRAWGATALSSGCLDAAGDPVEIPGRPWMGQRDTKTNVERIRLTCPEHPYSIAGDNAWTRMTRAGEFIVDRLGHAGLSWAGSWVTHGHLMTTGGTVRPAGYRPAAAHHGDLWTAAGGNVLIAGIQGLGDVRAGFLARRSEELLGKSPLAWAACGHMEIPFPGQAASAPQIARALDIPAVAGEFVRQVGGRTRGHGYTHILFPPVLGVRAVDELLAALGKETGARCAELIPLTPSVPGIRLQTALDTALIRSGVEVRDAAAAGVRLSGKKVTGVAVRGSGADIVAGSYVLATGRFTGGGIMSRGWRNAMETVSGLPAECSPDGLAAGVRVGPDMRPVDPAGEPLRDNLFCAGAVIGGCSPSREWSGAGMAVLTGAIAGEHATGKRP